MKLVSLRAKRSNLLTCKEIASSLKSAPRNDINLMMSMQLGLLTLGFILWLSGCQTAVHKPGDTRAETVSALMTMTQGLTHQPMTQTQLKNLVFQVAHDSNAQSALRSINTALSVQHTVKYCPENGERFSADMIYCPDHKVKLEWVE